MLMVPEMVRTAPDPAPILPGRIHLRLNQFGMIGQPEIIVACQIDYLAAIEARYRFARRFEHAQTLVRARFAPGFELLGEVCRVGSRWSSPSS